MCVKRVQFPVSITLYTTATYGNRTVQASIEKVMLLLLEVLSIAGARSNHRLFLREITFSLGLTRGSLWWKWVPGPGSFIAFQINLAKQSSNPNSSF